MFILLQYQIGSYSTLFSSGVAFSELISGLKKIYQQSVIFSFIAHLLVIPQLVQLLSTATYSYFVYENPLGVWVTVAQ